MGLALDLCRSHPAYFGEYVLGLKPAPFHLEWQDLCTAHRRLILIGPIEHGKTQQLSIIRPLWELGRNPNLRIALISETERQAYKWLARIKANIESNARVQELFPRLVPAVRRNRWEHWHEDSILVTRDRAFSFREKDYSIEAIGVGKAIMGARFDVAVLDDTVTPRNGYTPTGRQHVYDWLKQTLLGRIPEDGSVWIPNNAVHSLDMPHTLEREQPDVWHVARYAAGEPNCRWGQWSDERLAAKRVELGAVEFARQLQSVPLSDSTGLLPLASIRDCQDRCDDPIEWWGGGYPEDAFRWVTAGLDLGASEVRGSNLTAIAVVGMDHEGLKHLLHVRAGQWMGAELLRQMVDVQRHLRPKEWLVETNAAQAHLAALAADPSLLEAVGATLAEARSIRVYGQYTTQAGKRTEAAWAIRGMGADFDARRWRLPRHREVEELIREAGSYSFSEHAGDRLIALWLADARLRGRGAAMYLKVTSR